MPNTKTAWKNLRKNEKRRMRNRSIKSATKTEIKKFRKLVEEGMIEEAHSYLPRVYKKVDMAVSKGVFIKIKLLGLNLVSPTSLIKLLLSTKALLLSHYFYQHPQK